jgi:GH15 family glucan-1,4-alpha-glucosidase
MSRTPDRRSSPLDDSKASVEGTDAASSTVDPKDPAIWAELPPHVLREYALIADGHRGALIGPRGDIVWLCAPRWDSPAVLGSLVGADTAYAVTPAGTYVWGGYYEPGTLIWRNRWTTTASIVECRDALPHQDDPSTAGQNVTVLRRVEAHRQDALVDVVLDLRAGFGQHPMRQVYRGSDGTWTATTGSLRVRWRGAAGAHLDAAGRLRLQLHVRAGTHHDLVLEVSEQALAKPEPADVLWRRTERAWAGRVPSMADTLAPRDARHSYAVLHGLTTPGGGMVAAATLGLPERAERHNSYDYRYVWLRDQAYAGIASAAAGQLDLLDSAVAFATARLLEHGDKTAPAYRVDGTDLPHEDTLDLPGYPGGQDVTGNWVRGQTQLDAFGELLQLFATAAQHDHLDQDSRAAMIVAADHIATAWDLPDAGIWELEDRWWTHSRLSCVAGLHNASPFLPRAQAHRISALAQTIERETTRRCLAADNSWRRAAGLDQSHGVDAALLLPPVRGALAARDPRTRATLRAAEITLVEDGYLYRFAPQHGRLGEDQGAFLLCGFVMALAQWHQGDQASAVRWFERNRAACGPAGLFAEEYDVQQRQLRGNLPQAFVHAVMLETSARLTKDPPSRGRTP